MADHLAARGPDLRLPGWTAHCRLTERVLHLALAEREAPAPRLVTGHDIMQRFGLPPGPAIGRLVELAREAQAAGDVASRDEALALLAQHLDRGPETIKDSEHT
jgi:poly(A) polymerase/tRNA nucleotidyltransferase (CCA-adding enzyme)